MTLAGFLDLPSTEGTELHLKCRLYSNVCSEVIQNPGLVAVGPRAALSPSVGTQAPGGGGCFCFVSAACSAVRDQFYAQTPAGTAHSQHLAMPTLYLHVHVGSFWFALLLWVLSVQPEAQSLAFYSEGGEVCGEVRLHEKGTLLLRPEVKKKNTFLHSI